MSLLCKIHYIKNYSMREVDVNKLLFITVIFFCFSIQICWSQEYCVSLSQGNHIKAYRMKRCDDGVLLWVSNLSIGMSYEQIVAIKKKEEEKYVSIDINSLPEGKDECYSLFSAPPRKSSQGDDKVRASCD